jgi:outer membrane receptor protein involved in Fe transport
LPGLEVGVDAYYKLVRDLLDDGQFGQAYVLTGFNYDKGFNKGVELIAKYRYGNLRAYANLAWAQQMATPRGMNEFLFDRYEIAYIGSHYIYTDHAQTWTGSAGVSYLWNGTRYSADVIYGSSPKKRLLGPAVRSCARPRRASARTTRSLRRLRIKEG